MRAGGQALAIPGTASYLRSDVVASNPVLGAARHPFLGLRGVIPEPVFRVGLSCVGTLWSGTAGDGERALEGASPGRFQHQGNALMVLQYSRDSENTLAAPGQHEAISNGT